MKQQFVVDGKIVRPVDIPDDLLQTKVPLGIYAVKFNKMMGFYLELAKEVFEMPVKLYGSTAKRAQKIQKVYNSDDKSLGVLLTGLKGAGKSLLIKEIANTMLQQDLPVIMVQDNFAGTEFLTFVESLGECVIMFDEFGKTYKTSNADEENEQHQLLTFFDGVYSSKRLILLAENKTWDIDDLFLDRPSRVKFHWKFDRLEEDVIDGFCEDNLENTKILPGIKKIYEQSKSFTFDSLQTIVDQANLFKDEEFEEIIDGLNIPLKDPKTLKAVLLIHDGKDITKDATEVYDNGHSIYCNFKQYDEDGEFIHNNSLYLEAEDFVSVVNGTYTYAKNGYELRYIEQESKQYSLAF